MEINKLTLAVLAATSASLVGCGGSSSSSSDEELVEDIEEPEVVEVPEFYVDTAWSVGSDELVGLTYPKGAEDGDLIALKRSVDSEDNVSHTLMMAGIATKEFEPVEGIALEQDYYRDVLALPVKGNIDGAELDTTLIATCGYEEPSVLEGGTAIEGGEGGEGGAVVAARQEKVAITEETQTPASLEIFLVGTDVSASLDINDETEGNYFLVDCHSLGGISVSDLISKGESAYEIDFYITGQDNTGEVAVVETNLLYDYESNEITESDFSVQDSINEILAAVSENPEDDYLVAALTENNTLLLNELNEGGIVIDTEGNPFTSETEESATILDLVYSGDNLLAVSADAGLAGADFTGEEFVMLTDGDYANCVDQLAVNGTTVWCHNSTDEGKLIEFTAPTVPQSEVPQELASTDGASERVSKEEAEQIKAELEGAGAEVEVK